MMSDFPMNVYGIKDDSDKQKNGIVPYYISEYANMNDRSPTHLLMVASDIEIDNEKSEKVNHFAWIRNILRLVSIQISKHRTHLLICDPCLCHF